MTSALLEEIITECLPYTANGSVVSYIPELQKVNPALLGISVADSNGNIYSAGDSQFKFSAQSIAKMLIFTCALLDSGSESVFQKVSVEPTSDAFNSIISLETKNFNRPLNPMINSGAIVGLTLVNGKTSAEKSKRILDFARMLSGNDMLEIDTATFHSEKATGSRNRALAYYMKSTGVIDSDVDVEELLDAYFRICSICVDCADLAKIALIYAMKGFNKFTGVQLVPNQIVRIVNATIALCGMYDDSGNVAVSVGVPSKGGVGGGILSVVPGRMGIGVFGPALNSKGTAAAGLAVLESLSRRLDLSIY